ncbi:MAG: Ig-like domain-containing protein [Planctomycetota bacterium]
MAVGALSAGCAWLQVEVDVYKGSLANEAHVQTQQVAVMATGAKPLLIALRDELEWEDAAVRERVRAGRSEVAYREGYMSRASHTAPAQTVSVQAVPDVAVLTMIGETTPVRVTATFSDGTMGDVTARGLGSTYTSSNSSIATVDQQGVVTAVADGTPSSLHGTRARLPLRALRYRLAIR